MISLNGQFAWSKWPKPNHGDWSTGQSVLTRGLALDLADVVETSHGGTHDQSEWAVRMVKVAETKPWGLVHWSVSFDQRPCTRGR